MSQKRLTIEEAIAFMDNIVKNWNNLDLETKKGVAKILTENSLNEIVLMCEIAFGRQENEI